jgi:hypothetical protein
VWLVVSQDGDADAAWLVDGLRTGVDEPIVLVTAGHLVHDCRWEHRVGRWGASTRLTLGDGSVIDSDAVGAVLNRLLWISADGFRGADPRDRRYATAEFYALALSWLHSLGARVLNRPAGTGLAGAWRTDISWRALARLAGLPVLASRSSDAALDPGPDDDRRVLLVDGEPIEDRAQIEGWAQPWQFDDMLRAGLAELQRASGLDVLEARFTGQDVRALRSVVSVPELQAFGAAALEALVAAMGRRAAGRPVVGSRS